MKGTNTMERNGVYYLSIEDSAKTLGFSAWAIRQWCKNKKIPFIRVGQKYMIDIQGTLETLREESDFKQ